MKTFRIKVFLLLPFLLFLETACTGGSDKNATISSTGETSAPPPTTTATTTTSKENSNDTFTRLAEYALLIQQPSENVFAAWKEYSAANHLMGLNDLDLSSEETLRSFIGDFILKTDLSFKATATKLFGSDFMMIKFQGSYSNYTSENADSVGGGTDGESGVRHHHNPSAIFSDMQNLRTTTSDFARTLANDLNVLFPNRFTFAANVSQCNNSLCNDFVQRSVTFLNSNVRERTLREADPITNVSALESFTAFFTSVFNNLTFTVADKSYTFHNFKTGETRLMALPQEYAFGGLTPQQLFSNTSNIAGGTDSPAPPNNSNTAVGVAAPGSTQWEWAAPNWEGSAPDSSTSSRGSGRRDPSSRVGGTGGSFRGGGADGSTRSGGTDGQP